MDHNDPAPLSTIPSASQNVPADPKESMLGKRWIEPNHFNYMLLYDVILGSSRNAGSVNLRLTAAFLQRNEESHAISQQNSMRFIWIQWSSSNPRFSPSASANFVGTTWLRSMLLDLGEQWKWQFNLQGDCEKFWISYESYVIFMYNHILVYLYTHKKHDTGINISIYIYTYIYTNTYALNLGSIERDKVLLEVMKQVTNHGCAKVNNLALWGHHDLERMGKDALLLLECCTWNCSCNYTDFQ